MGEWPISCTPNKSVNPLMIFFFIYNRIAKNTLVLKSLVNPFMDPHPHGSAYHSHTNWDILSRCDKKVPNFENKVSFAPLSNPVLKDGSGIVDDDEEKLTRDDLPKAPREWRGSESTLMGRTGHLSWHVGTPTLKGEDRHRGPGVIRE